MRRVAFDSLDREGLIGVAQAQAEAIERLSAEGAALRAELAELRAKLDRPLKTPDNSSIPPSRGQKTATEFVKSLGKKKPHPGAHRPLHPNPTHRRDVLAQACGHCGADVSQSPQEPCEVYDRIELPPIAPEVTRVSLHGGVCPCCANFCEIGASRPRPRRGLSQAAPPMVPTCAPSSSICASRKGSVSSACRA